MRRLPSPERPNLAALAAAAGFSFATSDGRSYWDETVRYEFSLDEIERSIEAPTRALQDLCLELVERAVSSEPLLHRLGVSAALHDLARSSWQAAEPSLYGRFDLRVAPDCTTKMLEFNADTPTSLYESAVFQWAWLEQGLAEGTLPRDTDQFNSIHDALVSRWPDVARGARVHFASLDNAEDEGTTSYLRETARLAGVDVAAQMLMCDIGLRDRRFVDLAERDIDCLFKLYPWEWLAADAFGTSPAMRDTRFIEPAWKAILSSKAILPLLWEMAPGHPNLLPARFEDEASGTDVGRAFVRKRCHSREGANIDIVADGVVLERTDGAYAGRTVLQAYAPLPVFDGRRPVIGSWIVGDRPCGIGIREGAGAITTNASRFVPHLIV